MRGRNGQRTGRAARWLLAIVAGFWLLPAAAQPDGGLRIGIIGTGNIGGTLARYWAAAGHELVISSRHPEELEPLAAELGPKVRTGMPGDAAVFGDVILVSVPYGALPAVGREHAAALAGKIVLDTGNPFEFRDGDIAADALARGTGVVSAELLPGARLVRAFNTVEAATLRSQSNRQPARIAVPLASDDSAALQVAERLVRDAGFDPIVVGGLDRAIEFDVDRPLYRGDLSAAEFANLMETMQRCWSWLAAVSTTLCEWFF